MIHRAHHAAPPRRPAEPDALTEICRLEDERGRLWAAGVTTERQRLRLAEINRDLSEIRRALRRERAGPTR